MEHELETFTDLLQQQGGYAALLDRNRRTLHRCTGHFRFARD